MSMATWNIGSAFIPESAFFPFSIMRFPTAISEKPTAKPIIATVPSTLRKKIVVTRWIMLKTED